MKPESENIRQYRLSVRLLFIPAFFFIFISSYPQDAAPTDSLLKIRGTVRALDAISIRLSFNSPVNPSSSKLIPPYDSENEKNLIFLDTLKSKASKTLITRKLYDFVIISNGPASGKVITGSSDGSYRSYSGMKIRKIEIRRLGVFGTNINIPDYYDPNKIEDLLNMTHANTNERIIRKNLLFSEGDTISPLTLSDNERYIRELPYIDDARILVVPVSDADADIIVSDKGCLFTWCENQLQRL